MKQPNNAQQINIKVSQDGDTWCALIGDNLQSGISGFGDDIAQALHDLANNIPALDQLTAKGYNLGLPKSATATGGTR